jgi:hypothetical protein
MAYREAYGSEIRQSASWPVRRQARRRPAVAGGIKRRRCDAVGRGRGPRVHKAQAIAAVLDAEPAT